MNIRADYETVEKSDPQSFVVSLNVARRHLTTFERARLANREATGTHGGDRRTDQGASVRLGTPPTQRQAAAKYNVGERTLQLVKAIESSGDRKLIAAVESGDLSIKRAAAKVAPREARRRRRAGEIKSPIPVAAMRSFKRFDRRLVYRCGREL